MGVLGVSIIMDFIIGLHVCVLGTHFQACCLSH